jgi:ABC-type multidrug transport system ATPase subunit
VLFALAICGDPDLLFLDEPTVGLDVEARRLLWNEIRNLVAHGKTVLLTTHYLQEADALADRVVVINHGKSLLKALLRKSEHKPAAGESAASQPSVRPACSRFPE